MRGAVMRIDFIPNLWYYHFSHYNFLLQKKHVVPLPEKPHVRFFADTGKCAADGSISGYGGNLARISDPADFQ